MLRAVERLRGYAPSPGARLAGPVLVATAGTSGAGALRVARLLAERRGERPTVVSVLDPQPRYAVLPEPQAMPPIVEAARRDARRTAVETQVRDALGAAADLPIEVVVGEPARALADGARRHDAALVVVGRGRHDAPTRVLREETELRILQRVPCPVLAVPDDVASLPRIAVAAVDFSPLSVAAAQAALDVLDAGGALHLVHVWAPLPGGGAWERERNARYANRLDGRFARATAALHVPADVRVETLAIEAPRGTRATVDALLARADELHADLVSVGRQSHGLLERLLVGSVATGVIRGAARAVLATPLPSPAIVEGLSRHMRGGYEARTADEWAVLLDRFTQRNAGRRSRLERFGTDAGVQAQQVGHALIGAAYDPHDDCVDLMFGERGGAHLTHAIPRPATVAVVGDDTRGDVALRIDAADGWTLVTFVPDAEA